MRRRRLLSLTAAVLDAVVNDLPVNEYYIAQAAVKMPRL